MKLDKNKKYVFGLCSIKFSEGKWRVINPWGFGVYSDKSFSKCKGVLKELGYGKF